MSIRKLARSLLPLAKGLYRLVAGGWGGHPNVHLSSDAARLSAISSKNINYQCFIRPSFSDQARANEFRENIYYADSYMGQAVKSAKPKLLVDIGANIGLSSLSLLQAFPSLKKVVGVEADLENYKMLKLNYELWSSQYPVTFTAIHGVADCNKKLFYRISSLGKQAEGFSASGTFQFTPDDQAENGITPESVESVVMQDIFNSYQSDCESVICKIDIEGGEQYLLAENTDWFESVDYLTIEIHDRFDAELINSSRGILKLLLEHDFAIHPQNDVLHCYARRIF